MPTKPTNTPNLNQNTYLIHIQDTTFIQGINLIRNMKLTHTLNFTLKTKYIHKLNNTQSILPTQNKKPNLTQNLIYFLETIPTLA